MRIVGRHGMRRKVNMAMRKMLLLPTMADDARHWY
jgi:hypothetical protein